VSNRIELEGRVLAAPEFRVTPAGTPLLRLRVDCGERPGELVMPVIIAGDDARSLAEELRVGSTIRLTGALRVLGGGSARISAVSMLEVAAQHVQLMRPD
jgi:primosomal replication protein N